MSSARTLSDVIGKIRSEEMKSDINDICESLAKANELMAGVDGSGESRMILWLQILKLRTMEARL